MIYVNLRHLLFDLVRSDYSFACLIRESKIQSNAMCKFRDKEETMAEKVPLVKD